MKNLFGDWSRIQTLIKQRPLLICLDYDGTLSPIAPTPRQAVLPTKTKQVLQSLVASHGISVAVISGRAMSDVTSLVGLKGIIYSGNHGFEAEGGGIKFKLHIPPAYDKAIMCLEKTLKDSYKTTKGVIVENKKPFLAVHYRLANKRDIPNIRKIFWGTVKKTSAKRLLRTKTGKMILEIQPSINWNKGKIVLWLLTKKRSMVGGKKILPIYVGDDITDEDAFHALRNRGITVFVGHSRTSCAQYSLSDTNKVHAFLKRIVSLKSSEKP